MTRLRNRPARPGYTLVEILVVMTLIILLAALALGISQTGMFGSQKVISAGDRASGWLLIAKQRALRDGAPRGVRFFNTAGGILGNVNAFTEAVYIENPEPWIPNPAQEGNPTGPRIVFSAQWWKSPVAGKPNVVSSTQPTWVTASGPTQGDPSGNVNPPKCYFVSGSSSGGASPSWQTAAAYTADMSEFDQRVSPNDTLVLPEFGKGYRITSINTSVSEVVTIAGPGGVVTQVNPNAMRELVLLNPPDFSAAGTEDPRSVSASNAINRLGTLTTYKFGFQRPAQPLLGEPALQLTGGTSIDFREPRTPAAVGAAVEPALLGYRTWSTPAPSPATTPNSGPYNPPTTIGVTAQKDQAAAAGGLFFDVLFSPSGQVLDNNSGILCLWVRETSKAPHPRFDTAGNFDTPLGFDQAGAQVLIVINTRNGLLSTQPINTPPATASTGYDPYAFAKDGINSGL